MKEALFVISVAFASTAWAASPFDFDPNAIVSGSNLTGNELGIVANTIALDLKFRPVEGARAKPGPWTLSLGVLGGAMSASKLKDAFPTNDVPPVLPTGDLVLVLQVTRDFAAELGFIPTISVGSNKFSKLGLGVKWTATNAFFGERAPFALAFRANYTKPTLNLVSGTTELAYDGSMIGFNATMGFGGGGFEPYLGLGYTSASANLTGSGSADFFGTPISLTQAVPVSTSSVEFFGGFALQGGPVGLAVQAEYGFGSLMGVLKLSLQIGPFGDSEPRAEQRVARRRPPPARAPASQPAPAAQPQQRPGQPAQQRQQPKQQRPDEAPPAPY